MEKNQLVQIFRSELPDCSMSDEEILSMFVGGVGREALNPRELIEYSRIRQRVLDAAILKMRSGEIPLPSPVDLDRLQRRCDRVLLSNCERKLLEATN